MNGIFQRRQKPFSIFIKTIFLKKEAKAMRKRGIRIQVWVNNEEDARLQANAKKSGLSREGYLRSLINGYIPKAAAAAGLLCDDARASRHWQQS
ncbi:hypothetical protein LJK88_04230 [Paenibacillus sp. P26]|nr:hypothetical protein LJK88_04230 [Paenibacillus sp. P26]